MTAMVAAGLAVLLAISPVATSGFTPRRKSEVTWLPGLDAPNLPSRQYTGHVPVHNGQHQMWYWLIESEGQPDRDPVVLWLTGGPGCSSMDALIYENGPYTFSFAGCTSSDHAAAKSAGARHRGIQLNPNPYSWTKAATMVYVDSPVGVGLSYSTTQEEIHTDDQRTTDDLLEFITQLLRHDYPHLLANPLYIAGESYAGVFVPTLVTKLLAYNEQAPEHERLNLKGYAVGNGVTDDKFDGDGQPEFAYAMGLIDPPTYSQLRDVCQGNFWNATPGGECAQQLHDAYDRFYWLNPYDILADCFRPHLKHGDEGGDGHCSPTPQLFRRLLYTQSHALSISHLQAGRWQGVLDSDSGVSTAASGMSGMPDVGSSDKGSWPMAAALAASHVGPLVWPLAGVRAGAGRQAHWQHIVGYSVPCSDRRIALQWMNTQAVREVLHAPPVSERRWQPCSEHVHYQHVPISMIPHHLEALKQGMRVLIYSGDHDFVVPFTGTRDWVYSLGLKMTRPYAPWTIEGQVAGFLVEFEGGLQFVTVKGAGHMVPQTSPSRALHLITRFLNDNL